MECVKRTRRRQISVTASQERQRRADMDVHLAGAHTGLVAGVRGKTCHRIRAAARTASHKLEEEVSGLQI